MRLYLRYRDDSKASSVSICPYACPYDKDTRTCYTFFGERASFDEQRLNCRDMGGELIYSLDSTEYPGYVSMLRQAAVESGLSPDEDVWIMGMASEPRPVVDMTTGPSGPTYPCLSLKTGAQKTCGKGQQLTAVCALAPREGEAPPKCPPVAFEDYGLTFPETAPGKTVSQPCGAGYTGSASYMCGVDGQWSSQYPDLS